MEMKRVEFGFNRRSNAPRLLHVETPQAVINVRPNLTVTATQAKVDSIEILGNESMGEESRILINGRLYRALNVRVVAVPGYGRNREEIDAAYEQAYLDDRSDAAPPTPNEVIAVLGRALGDIKSLSQDFYDCDRDEFSGPYQEPEIVGQIEKLLIRIRASR